MTQILIVEKDSKIKCDKVSNETDLYKKCGFRKNEGFEKITNFEKQIDNHNVCIEVWGRKTGKANNKNNYNFPSPIDKTKIYGNCVLVRKHENELMDIDEDLWTKMSICEPLPTETPDETKNTKIEVSSNEKNTKIEKNCKIQVNNKIEVNNKIKENNKIDDDNLSDDTVSSFDSDSEDSNTDDENSELKEEAYIYSDEEEK